MRFNRPKFYVPPNHPLPLFCCGLFMACVGALLLYAHIGEQLLARINGTLALAVVVEHKVNVPSIDPLDHDPMLTNCLVVEHPVHSPVRSKSVICKRYPGFLPRHPIGFLLNGSSKGDSFTWFGRDPELSRVVLALGLCVWGVLWIRRYWRLT